ncbi:MAG: TetR/AcrR family transcriptional regulator [Lachnospiraceae bacterium]|nr:TetR/AcrR family transcriptional regulator [Lachnospiraceae bacterium]
MNHNQKYKNTEQLLYDGFISLLGDKLPSEIKMTDLINASGVHTTTFYYHFPDGMPEFLRKFAVQALESTPDQLLFIYQNPVEELLSESLPNALFPFRSSLEKPAVFQSKDMIWFLDLAENYIVQSYQAKSQKQTDSFSWKVCATLRASWGSMIELINYLNTGKPAKEEVGPIIELVKEEAYLIIQHAFPEKLKI